MEQLTEKEGALLFAVNQERFELSSVDPSITLLQFLRSHTRFKSVKLGCGEGGCGACVVLLSKYDPVLDKVEAFTVSSCLTLLCSLNGCSVTTSEGLGNSKDGFHSIHQRFAGFHASQCGFCTPGMCISLFGALVNAEKTNRPDPLSGFSKLTVSEAEKAVSGNLCRCTGYRSIADACKSFAADVDMEDLGLNSFWHKGYSEEVKLSKLPLYNQSNGLYLFPEFLKKEFKSIPFVDSKGRSWCNPRNIEALKKLLECNDPSNLSKSCRTKLVVGNTGVGYYKEFEYFDRYINLKYIPELSVIKMDSTGMKIGATVTISKAIEALKNNDNSNNNEIYSIGEMVFKKIADHMEKIASGFVRNTASIGGNLIMAQKKQFPSDIATILLAAGSMINILTGSGHEMIMLEEFLKKPPLDPKCVLLSIKIPNWDSVKNIYPDNTILRFETFRASPRPLGNALPYLNAAFLAAISPCESSTGIMLSSCHLAFGAYGTKHAIRARKVEGFLAGKIIDYNVIYEAVLLIGATIVPEKGTSSPAYRTSLAVGFLFKFLSSLIDGSAAIKNDCSNACKSASSTLPYEFNLNHNLFGYDKTATLLSSGKQLLELSSDYHPVGDAITKSGAAIQASGEAIYVDDIPSPTNCLHGAFIYSTKPLARVKGFTFSPKSHPEGVIAVISTEDIPMGGRNIGCRNMFGDELLFADELTECAGQPLAFVVADTQKHADMAASFAVVNYDLDNLEAPILSVEDALKRSSFFEVPSILYPKQVGDISKGMAEADHHINAAQIRLGSQYYFYMETQTALAIPDEDNCMVVYSSSQWPAYAHVVIARCLGIPEHSVRVITRRVGGGFGGKAMKSMPVATACALAAHKLRRPVRIYLNRKTDMIMVGGRHPMKITYSVGFKSNGKITALQLEILVDAGMSADISPIMPYNIVGALKKYDWGALSFDIKVCKTNHSSKSAMRAPGEVQGSFIAEAVIERVASALSMDVDSIREINLHTLESLSIFYKDDAGEPQEYTLPSIWDRLAASSSLKQRTKMVDKFNSCNRWQKRGLSRIPIVHKVMVRPTPGKVSILTDGSIVVEVGGIELGQGLWTKVRQMAAYALSSIQCDGTSDLLEKVRVVQSDTVSLIQGGCTAGSTTSESSCEAVRLCCNILVERLTPLKKRLQEQMGSIKWDVLIDQANLQSVNLSAHSLYVPDFVSMCYLNYGAAVSEVEVNLLTGETTVLRADIIYDCGQSLNPAVDLGQVEGAFVQGIGFFMFEEYQTNSDGLVISDSTWTYKIPTLDTIPKQFNVELLNSGLHQKRTLSSKASGEPPLLLAASVHFATRAAIKEARKQMHAWNRQDESDSAFQLDVPATMPVVKQLCGLDCVESYLKWSNESRGTAS